MNRSIMNRQMFREGGSAFPDFSGDGKITQKDILMGRGVIPKPMQEGGMMPPQAEMMPPPPPPAAMMPPAPPPEAMMPPPPPQEEMMGVGGLQEESGIDPATLEQFMAAAAQNFGDLETAEDYEEMINRLRGDQMPIAGRRQELAEFVGPEDAQRTPESVLAMVQPVIMLNEVDQGIGGLAQDQMMEPVTGDMAGGIMSTVAGVEEAPAPVNFRQGGAVQKFATENQNRVAGNFELTSFPDLFKDRRELIQEFVTPSVSAEDLAKQKRLNEAQMFFDLANTGLALATPGKQSESLAQSIARAAQDTQLFDKIGARSQAQLEAEKALNKEKQALDLMAFKSAEDLALEQIKNKYRSPQSAENFLIGSSIVSATPGSLFYDQLVGRGAARVGAIPFSEIMADQRADRTQYTLTKSITIDGREYEAGSNPFFSNQELTSVINQYGPDVVTKFQEPLTDKDFLTAYKMTKEQFEALPEEDKQFVRSTGKTLDVALFEKFGLPGGAKEWNALEAGTKARLLGIEPQYEFKVLEDGNVKKLLAIDKNTKETMNLGDYDIRRDAKLFEVILPQEDGTVLKTTVDINSDEGMKLVDKANQLRKEGKNASIQKVGTASTKTTLYIDFNTNEAILSKDGGRTYHDEETNTIKEIPNRFIPVSSEIAFSVAKSLAIKGQARAFLKAADRSLAGEMVIPVLDANGQPVQETVELPDGKTMQVAKTRKLTKEELGNVNNSLDMVRAGTGPWAKFGAGVNATVGGLLFPESSARFFKETTEGRQFVGMLRIMGRSALASSPRFAVADLKTTEQLFPNEETFFANPVSEVEKLKKLYAALLEEEIRIQSELATGLTDETLRTTYITKLSEIDKLKNLLEPLEVDGDVAISRRNVDKVLEDEARNRMKRGAQ